MNDAPQYDKCEVLSTGIDWVTATTKSGQRGRTTQAAVRRWFEERENEGHEEKDWTWKGYVGRTIDGLSSGQRSDGYIIRLSGEMAKRHGHAAILWADRVSRIDLQVTIAWNRPSINLAVVALQQAQTSPSIKNGHTTATIISKSPTGDTLYIGQRVSDRYMRVYDKFAESGGEEPEGSWRFEVEYKGKRAEGVVAQLVRMHASPEAIRGIVEQAFWQDNVHVPCESLPRDWLDKGNKHKTTDEKRLQWLRTSVSPMIGRLLKRQDAAEVLEALGLAASGRGGFAEISTGEVLEVG